MPLPKQTAVDFWNGPRNLSNFNNWLVNLKTNLNSKRKNFTVKKYQKIQSAFLSDNMMGSLNAKAKTVACAVIMGVVFIGLQYGN